MTRETFRKHMDKILKANSLFDELCGCRWISEEAIDAFGQALDIPVSIL